MNKVLCFVIALFLVVGVLCGCSSDSNSPTELMTEIPTITQSTVSVSDFVEHNYKNIKFSAPEDWMEEVTKNGYYLDLGQDYMYMNTEDVSYAGVEVTYRDGVAYLPAYTYRGMLNTILSHFDNGYELVVSQDEIINGHLFKHYEIKGVSLDEQILTYKSEYLTYDEGNLYYISFCSVGDSENINFAAAKDNIIQSMTFEPINEPTETPTNPPRLGKADNPAPLGEAVEVYENDMTVLNISIANVVSGDEAYNLIKGYNQFNSEPPEGYHYVLFDVNVECVSTNKSGGFRVRYSNFCAANSTKAILRSTSVAVVLENYLDATLLPGSMVTGKSAVLMPDDGDGYIVYDDRYFFALS